MPVASDLPMLDAVMIEIPNPKHPQGVRGVGEVPLVPVMAAVANAMHSALGSAPRQPADVAAEGAGGAGAGAAGQGRRLTLGARHSSGASWERGPLARIMIMSGPEARAPEDEDAPLEWRAPSYERKCRSYCST